MIEIPRACVADCSCWLRGGPHAAQAEADHWLHEVRPSRVKGQSSGDHDERPRHQRPLRLEDRNPQLQHRLRMGKIWNDTYLNILPPPPPSPRSPIIGQIS